MALSNDDIESFVTELRNNADLRDRIRAIIFSDDFLRLPMYVYETREVAVESRDLAVESRDLAVESRDLAVESRDLAVENRAATVELQRNTIELQRGQERLSDAIRMLTEEVQKLDGRSGNLEGWRYEMLAERHLAAHIGHRYKALRPTPLVDHPAVEAAYDAGLFAPEDWASVLRIDLAVSARRRDVSGAEVLLMIEVSKTVDARDVTRAFVRAGILTDAGIASQPVVIGQRILRDAAIAAERQGVEVFIDKPDPVDRADDGA